MKDLKYRIRTLADRADSEGAHESIRKLYQIQDLLEDPGHPFLDPDTIFRFLDSSSLRQEIEVDKRRRIERWYTIRNILILLLLTTTLIVLILTIRAYFIWSQGGFHDTTLFLSTISSWAWAIPVGFAPLPIWFFFALLMRRARYRTELICTRLSLELQSIAEEIIMNSRVRSLGPSDDLSKSPMWAVEVHAATTHLQHTLQQLIKTSDRIYEGLAQLNSSLSDQYAFDVYICYDSSDREEVEVIAEQLKAQGLKPWLDVWEIRPGEAWQSTLEKQLSHIRSAAVFLGKKGIGPWQNNEVRAILREFVEQNRPVIPILLPECDQINPELPAFLKNRTWIDFQQKDLDPLQMLIWGITGRKEAL